MAIFFVRGGGGAESLEEVSAKVLKLFGKGTVMAPDGSPASHAAAKKGGKPSLKGVSHLTKVFTPVSKLLKSTLQKDEIKMLRSNSKGKGAAVKETKLYFVLCGGDNAAESQSGHIRNTMRRVGNLGRFATKAIEKKNIQTLAAAALLRNSGYKTILDALKQYRIACSSGVVSVAPRNTFNVSCVKDWIFK